MGAEVISGKALAEKLREDIKIRTEVLTAKGTVPRLEVILAGNNPASEVYVKNKLKCAEKLGIDARLTRFSEQTSENELICTIGRFNSDPAVHGILVQLPLPDGLDESKVLACIDPSKDVDGLHTYNAGALATGRKGFLPCTPKGIMAIIDSIGYDLEGKNVVVVGRSNLVGKPVARLLMQKNATVTVCHSKTKNLGEITKMADVLVVAIGCDRFIKGNMIKQGAVVIDVGMNRVDDKWHGDVDFENAVDVAGYITPVPGGVGPMTITMLMDNTVESAEKCL